MASCRRLVLKSLVLIIEEAEKKKKQLIIIIKSTINILHSLDIAQQHRVQLNTTQKYFFLDQSLQISVGNIKKKNVLKMSNKKTNNIKISLTVLSIVFKISVSPLITSENLKRLKAIRHSLFCSKFKRI